MTKNFKLGTGIINGRACPLVLVNKKVHSITEILGDNAPSSLQELFSEWVEYEAVLVDVLATFSGEGTDIKDIEFLTPINNPRKVICIGTNYHDHLKEMKISELPKFPYAFLRPQFCLAAHEEEIPLPGVPKMIDWEAEMGIVIGQMVGPNSEVDPIEAVAGYTVINDVSARDWIHSRPFVGIDWVMQKAWDKFQPTGPWITPARFVVNPEALDISLQVNSVVKQKSNTRELIFGVRDIMVHLAGITTLEPGDIIATGTPAGVGFGSDPQEFIKSGDIIEVTVEGLGKLRNKFV